MKRFFLTVLALFLTVLFTGCGNKSKEVEIEFITNRTDMVLGIPDSNGKHDPNTAEFRKLADKFKKETGIKVKLTAYTDFKNALRRRLSSGNYGDVITDDQFPKTTLTTFFQPIGNKDNYQNYYFIDYASIGNKVYGLSPGYYIDGVVYNKEILKDAGFSEFPANYSDLIKLFKKIKLTGKIPIIINRGQFWPQRFIEQMAAEISGNKYAYVEMWKSNAPFSTSYPIGNAMQKAAEWINNGWTESEFIKMWEESKTQIASGKAFMMYLGSWILPQIQARSKVIKGGNPEKIGYAPFPKLDSQSKHYILIEPEKPLLISKKTKHLEACKKWINYLIKSKIYETQGALPIIKSEKTGIPQLQKILDGVAEGKYTFIDDPPTTAHNGERTLNLLKDLDLFADRKYIGKAFDKAKVSMKDYEKCINQMNEQFAEAKKNRNI